MSNRPRSKATPLKRHSAAVTDLALHRELRRLGLIARDDHLAADGATRLVRVLDEFNAPFLKSLDTFLPPRSAAARRATRDADRGYPVTTARALATVILIPHRRSLRSFVSKIGYECFSAGMYCMRRGGLVFSCRRPPGRRDRPAQ